MTEETIKQATNILIGQGRFNENQAKAITNALALFFGERDEELQTELEATYVKRNENKTPPKTV